MEENKKTKFNIFASIVLYNNDAEELKVAILCLLNTKTIHTLFLIDNSPTNALLFLKELSSKINYIHNPTNPGFGAAHNLAINKAIALNADYHLVVNPDISFVGDIISPMINYMEKDKTIGMMMPQILNDDGTIQNLPKLLPSPLSIVWRKLKKPKKAYQKFIDTYELRTVPKNTIYNAPILSGCFTIFNVAALKNVGLYNDAYFMYFEDWDLSRRMHQKYKTIYFPEVSVYHGYNSGANKSRKLFKVFFNSAIKYFNKWGWFFDTDRKKINKKAVTDIK